MMHFRKLPYIAALIVFISATNAAQQNSKITVPKHKSTTAYWSGIAYAGAMLTSAGAWHQYKIASHKSSLSLGLIATGLSALSIYSLRQLYILWHVKTKQKILKTTYEAEIIPGVSYRQSTQENPSPLIIHELVIDPQRANITAHVACDTCSGAEAPSALATRQKAIAAINCSFFYFGVVPYKELFIKILDLIGQAQYNAFPMYALKINGNWLSLSTVPTGIFAWDDGGKTAVAGIAKTKCTLNVRNYYQFEATDFNKPNVRTPVIYTDDYGTRTPFGKNICSLIIKDNHITDINMGGGIEITKGTYVYAQCGEIMGISAGDPVNIVLEHQTENPALRQALEKMPYAIGSTPLLLYRGALTSTVEQEKSSFFTKPHPRTAIGIFPNGKWLFIVVDGRQSYSAGIPLKDLALYMQSRGCTSALNLDGGGSSTMIIENEIVNNPSGREYSIIAGERPGASCLLVTPRANHESFHAEQNSNNFEQQDFRHFLSIKKVTSLT